MNNTSTPPTDPVPLFGPEMLANPYPLYDTLRREDPVHWSEKYQSWILTRYDDVFAGLNDARLSNDRSSTFQKIAGTDELAPLFSFLRKRMLLVDPPEHTRLRGLVSKSFTPHMVDGMRGHIQQLVDGFLDPVVPTGHTDLIRDLAFPLPATVISEILGVPAEDRDQMKKWSDDFVAYFGTHPANVSLDQYRRSMTAMQEMVAYFRSKMPEARKRSCLLHLLETPAHDGDRLTEEELFANANLLMIAGHETTTGLIGNGTLALLQNPEQLKLLLDDPGLIPNAVEEFLRLVGPVQFTNRIALEDITVRGKTIRKGQFVFLFLGAANRDPDHFPDPNRLDVTRKEHKHVAMGLGHHFCLGAPLARLEAQIAFATILRRLPQLRLDTDKFVYRENFNLRGLVSLPLKFG